MRRIVCGGRIAVIAVLVAAFGDISAVGAPHTPVPLIFDTDIGNDVDDVLALGMIHALESRKECELLAVTVSNSDEKCAPFVDAVNTFYGRGEIPIGVMRDGPKSEPSKFLKLADERDGDRWRYSHDLMSGREAPDAVSVLRRKLADAEENSVVFVQVGFSTNLAALLASPADSISSLTGLELARHKVRMLSVMAGAFVPIEGKPFREFNILGDIRSAQELCDRWPTPVVFSGFEIGISMEYPAKSIEQDYSYVAHHPLAEAYCLFNPPPHNRPTWDLTSVLYAVRPDAGHFELSPPGRVTVADDGSTLFTPSANGPHRYLMATPEQCARARQVFVELATQPPTGAESR